MSERAFFIDGVKFVGGSNMEARLRALHEGAKASKTPEREEAAPVDITVSVEATEAEPEAEPVVEIHHAKPHRKHRS